jgi:anti-anti-sigma factor
MATTPGNDGMPRFVSCEVLEDAIIIRILVSKLRDAEMSYAVRDEMLAQLAATPVRKVIVDLQQVDFIGSVGFLGFLSIKRQLADGRIVFCNVLPYVLEAFKVCRLLAVDGARSGAFEVQATRDAAIASLAN